MRFLFDTNAIIIYFKNREIKSNLDESYNPLGSENTAIISIVTLGEIESLALRNKWSEKRIKLMEDFLNKFVIADINSKDVIRKYAEIDTFSQGKLENKKLGMSSRNMGKNDLWIAAIASVTDSTLITSDKDFDHLKDKYLSIINIDVEKNKLL